MAGDTVRDADLLAELEAARGTSGYEFKLKGLEHRQATRDRLAALTPSQRRRSTLSTTLIETPPVQADLRHMHSALAICGLPFDRLPANQRFFERRQGNMALDVTAGRLRDANGNSIEQPIPFGPKARLVLMHLCSEAVVQKSPTIEIADTFTGFVRDMGFSDSGGRKGPLTAFKEQLNALAACTMRLSVWNGTTVRSRNITPIEEINLFLANNHEQLSLWPSTVTFSPAMFESLQRHAMPLNMHVVRAFSASARKLDLYFWLSWRIHNIEGPLTLSWRALYEQFGGTNSNPRDFKRHFKNDLHDLKEVLTKLPARLNDNGLTIIPADPTVLALPPKRVASKKA